MLNTSMDSIPSRNLKTTAFMAACVVGFTTGVYLLHENAQNSSAIVEWVSDKPKVDITISAQDMIKKVLSSYGLAVKDFEPILGVKRAAIYNWKKGSNQPNSSQYEKLKELHSIASQLRHFDGKLGRLVKTYLYEDLSFIDRLSAADNIDVKKAVAHHDMLVRQAIKQDELLGLYSDGMSFSEDSFVYSNGNS
jgi:DNA-binding transcriptional regulator YiaG